MSLLSMAALCLLGILLLDFLIQRLRPDCILELEGGGEAMEHPRIKGVTVFPLLLSNYSPKEQAIVLQVHAHLLPRGDGSAAPVWLRVVNPGLPERRDGYWEACLIKPSTSLPIDLYLKVEDGGGDFLKRGPIALEVQYLYYGRKPLSVGCKVVSFQTDRTARSPGSAPPTTGPIPQSTPHHDSKAASQTFQTIPVRTHLLAPGDDLKEVVPRYTRGILKEGDLIAIAESAVAIAQGRVKPVAEIAPGFWARRINLFFHYNSSLASVYSLQTAIEEVGLSRILLATLAGILGRCLGRTGDFYRVAGRKVASIDDATGTLPPYDKSVVMGPDNPSGVAAAIAEVTGCQVCVVDANDLGEVDLLGKSSGVDDAFVKQALKGNPQGNAAEQTPIVVIRRLP